MSEDKKMRLPFFRRKDLLMIGALLLLAAVIYGVTLLTRDGQTLSGEVQISAGGEIYQTVPLGRKQEIRVEQADGLVNVIAIDGDRVYMAFSSCKNQLCVQQGEVTLDNWTQRAMGRSIICLPNHVVVELALEADHPSLEDYDAPDI